MTIRISNVSDSIKEEEFLDLLKKYGEISTFRMIEDRYTPKNLVIVYVDILDEKMADLAIQEFNELIVEGEKINAKVVSDS
jgi:RNA recognition motif-containing protein